MQPQILPADLTILVRSYNYNSAKMAVIESDILGKIFDYDPEYGPQLLRHLQIVSRNMKDFMIAEGYSTSDALKVSMAYLLHDAGKILQPASIWKMKENKNDRTEAENLERPRHGRLGLEVLSNSIEETQTQLDHDDLQHLQLARHLMVYHHERLDGSGPEKMTGVNMDPILRIATIVDAIDGKTKIKSMSTIFEDMTGKKHEGQFDRDIVNRYVAFIKEAPVMQGLHPHLAKSPNP